MSYKLHHAAFGGSHERDNTVAVHQNLMDRVRGIGTEGLSAGVEGARWVGWVVRVSGDYAIRGNCPFPRVNERAEFTELVRGIRWGLLTKVAERARLWVVVFGVAGMGIWWAMKGALLLALRVLGRD